MMGGQTAIELDSENRAWIGVGLFMRCCDRTSISLSGGELRNAALAKVSTGTFESAKIPQNALHEYCTRQNDAPTIKSCGPLESEPLHSAQWV